MTTDRTFVIVGAGLAGASAAATLREEGFDGRIILFGDEAALPYERPPLSKGYLRGEEGLEALRFRDEAFYVEHSIDLRRNVRVERLDLTGRTVVTERGVRQPFDRLLLATGSASRMLGVPGAGLPGVFHLRTIDDADAIRDAAGRAERAVVVGGGWIGAEVAASLRQLGLPVALVAPSSVPLESVLGQRVGSIYRDLHAEHGVELHMGERVASFVGGAHVRGVGTQRGALIKGDLVVVGVGVVPRVVLARNAGLFVRDGVVVDERLEAARGVFAAGDIAAARHPILERRLRVEHWDNAKRQGAAAALNMLGRGVAYDRLPYFYSDQFDLGMEYVGHASAADEVVVRGDPASREFIAFWLRDERPVAAMNANVWKVNGALRALVAAKRPVDRQRLADPDIPLTDLAASAASPGEAA